MLEYGINNRSSFKNIGDLWLKEIEEHSGSKTTVTECLMMIGNKTDLPYESSHVSLEEHENEAKKLKLLSYRTSAKSGSNITKAFEDLIIHIHDINQMRDKTLKDVEILEKQGRILLSGVSGGKPGHPMPESSTVPPSSWSCC